MVWVGADRFVGRVPEAEGLFRDRDAKAAFEVADRLAGGGAQVVAADRFHVYPDRIAGVLGDQVGEHVAACITAPALARLVAGLARALLDHILGAAARTARNGRIRLRWDVQSRGRGE